jgi:transposase-like protein
MNTEIGCFIQPEVAMQRRSSAESSRSSRSSLSERGVSVAQAGRDVGVHETVLRKWVKEFGSDPAPQPSMPQTSYRNTVKALCSLMVPRLGLLFQLCKTATTRLPGQLDKSRGQRHHLPKYTQRFSGIISAQDARKARAILRRR